MGSGGVMFSDNFDDEPLAHAGNQCGHAMIGLGLWLLAAVIWPGVGEVAALVIGAVYFLSVEWAWQRLKLLADSIEDACHVTLGAVIGFVLHHHGPEAALATFCGWGVVLAFGMWRRM
jgi:hypothetical protein